MALTKNSRNSGHFFNLFFNPTVFNQIAFLLQPRKLYLCIHLNPMLRSCRLLPVLTTAIPILHWSVDDVNVKIDATSSVRERCKQNQSSIS